MARIFSYETLIREKHLDTFGHVNHATYLELFEEARWEMMHEGGYGIETVKETGVGPVILEANCRYKRELGVRTPIVIETQWTDYTRRIARLHQRMWSPNRETEYAEVRLLAGLMDLDHRRLVRPTELWLKAIGLLGLNGQIETEPHTETPAKFDSSPVSDW